MGTVKKRLGEIVLRTAQKEQMLAFYLEVIGLELYAKVGSSYFLKISDDFDGHPQVLAIFDKERRYSGPKDVDINIADSKMGSLHHFAFCLELADYNQELQRISESVGHVETAQHNMMGWRSFYLLDPDGNSVEFVSFDPAILDIKENRKVRQGRH